jgi:hypothetical protein
VDGISAGKKLIEDVAALIPDHKAGCEQSMDPGQAARGAAVGAQYYLARYPVRSQAPGRAVIEVAHELRCRITSVVGSKAENICSQ